MSMLPFKIVQSDGGDLKVLATVADASTAHALFSFFVEDLHEEQGSYPTIWLEEWKEDRWVISHKEDIEENKRLILAMTEGQPKSRRLLWRHIGKAEQRFIIRAMEEYIQTNELSLHARTRGVFKKMHEDCSYGHSEFISKVEEHLFKPYEELDRMKNLVAFLRDRPIIVETYVLIPEQL